MISSKKNIERISVFHTILLDDASKLRSDFRKLTTVYWYDADKDKTTTFLYSKIFFRLHFVINLFFSNFVWIYRAPKMYAYELRIAVQTCKATRLVLTDSRPVHVAREKFVILLGLNEMQQQVQCFKCKLIEKLLWIVISCCYLHECFLKKYCRISKSHKSMRYTCDCLRIPE